ncbi:MAG: signal peptidase I [Oscillospiraceae bacterium]|nr:signal peptidase I [Oscillospiraceae bacterium]
MKKSDIRVELFEWAQALVSAILIFVFIMVFAVRIIGVEGTSMEPTLQNQDRMLISKLFYKPSNGDVIMFTKHGLRLAGHDDRDYPLVKRVIGIAGDTVDINFSTGDVFVNGRLIEEPYVKDPTRKQYDVNFPLTIPEGYVFVMGDNRNVSHDSRSSDIGLLDNRYILGKVYMRLFPFNKIGFIS